MSTAPPLPPAPLTPDGVLGLLEVAGSLRKGHFALSSGRHSDTYLQCALALQWPDVAELLGEGLATSWRDRVDVVVAPAMGGVVIGHEVSRALGVRMVFAERVQGAMTLRRGFALDADERALVVEDVVTTGTSAREVAALVTAAGAQPVGACAIVDRSPVPVPVPADGFVRGLTALLRVDAPSWEPDTCPHCAAGVPVDAPGSRRLAGGSRR